jgi:hypothetical protein
MMMKNNTLCRGKGPWGIHIRIWAQLELGTSSAIFTNSKLNVHIIDMKSALNMVTDDDSFMLKGLK